MCTQTLSDYMTMCEEVRDARRAFMAVADTGTEDQKGEALLELNAKRRELREAYPGTRMEDVFEAVGV